MSGRALQEKVSEVLAFFRESLGVARARCYAMDTTGQFRLVASYGFGSRSGPEDVLETGGPLIELVRRHRKPACANSPREAGPLAPMMERDQYARFLAAPVYAGPRLIGILELQDKLGGAVFTGEDLRQVEKVVTQLASALSGPAGSSVASPVPAPQEDVQALFLDESRPTLAGFPLHDLFDAAGEPARPQAPERPEPLQPPTEDGRLEPTRRELLVFRGFINALLLNPEIEAVVFSVWGRERAELHMGSRHSFSDSAREALLSNLESALVSVVPGVPVPGDKVFRSDFPLGRAPGEITEFAGVQTSVLFAGKSTLLLTIVFARPPYAATRDALKKTHSLVRAAVQQVRSAERYRASYRSLVHTLVEPGRKSYPQFKAHSVAVATWCRRFATALRLPSDTVEQFTVAGLLHDIGLRELEIPYERISGRRPLDLQELAVVRQHAVVGAELLERIEFPYPVAPLVRHHHERFDGAGYPDRLSGHRIPLGARIISIAEAYDAMTAPHSYRSTVSSEAALEIIQVKGGTHFDPDLTRRFCDLVRSGSPEDDGRRTVPGAGP